MVIAKNCMQSVNRHLIPVIFFLLLTVVFMLPAVLNLNTVLYGNPGVPYTAVWWGWWCQYAHLNGLDYMRPVLQGAPFGADYSHYPIQPIRPVYDFLFIRLNEIAAYNLIIGMVFFASALSAYTLVYFLTRKLLPSIIAGILFSFGPFHLTQATMHLWLATVQWIPVYFLLLWLLVRQTFFAQQGHCGIPIVGAGLFTLVLFENYYYGYMCFLITLCVFFLYSLYFFCRGRIQTVRFKPWIAFGGYCILMCLPALLSVLSNLQAAHDGLICNEDYIRPIEEVHANAARWFDYWIPSFVHPIWGEVSRKLFGHLYPNAQAGERTLCIGVVPTLLAVYAVGRIGKTKQSGSGNDRVTLFFLLITMIAGLLSLSAVGLILYRLFPMFRVYARFGIFVSVGISVLAAIGVSELCRKANGWRQIGTFCLLPLIMFEYSNFPPYPVIRTDVIPPVYQWLRDQPDNVIVTEYPLAEWDTFLHYQYLFYQRYHRKLLFNGIRPGTTGYDYLRQSKTLDEDSIKILKEVGIKYIVIHKDYFAANAEVSNVSLPLTFDGVELIKIFDKEEVYEIKYGKSN